jgi:hypothetical protein
MRRAFVLTLLAIACGLTGLYLVRAALVDAGGLTLGTADALHHVPQLATDWRFLVGGALILAIPLIRVRAIRHRGGLQVRSAVQPQLRPYPSDRAALPGRARHGPALDRHRHNHHRRMVLLRS